MIWRLAYTVVLWVLLPLVLARLWWRGRQESGYRIKIGERFGIYQGESKNLSNNKLIWLHAVSLGELRAARPLIEGLLREYPDCRLLLTQMTVTGREAAINEFGERALVHWLPYDYPFAIQRFLDHFSPTIGILMETEVWFNLAHSCHERGLPLMLANARLSEKSFAGYSRIASLAREAFGSFAIVAAQTETDAARFKHLGATVQVTGNLKFEAPQTTGFDDLARQFRTHWGARPVLLAASTREGEELSLLKAMAVAPMVDTLVVIVPRHPQRFDEVASLMQVRGLRYVRRSANQPVPPDCGIVLGDSLGEMPAYYRSSDLVLMGGSIGNYGSHNFIEACAEGRPVLLGPSTFNFEEAANAAIASGAARQCATEIELIVEAKNLLLDESKRAEMSSAARAFYDQHQGATAHTLALVAEMILSGARRGVS